MVPGEMGMVLVLVLVAAAASHVVSRDLESPAEDSDRFNYNSGKDQGKCQEGGCKEYVFDRQLRGNWFFALETCAKTGKQLATVNSKEEEIQLLETVKRSGGASTLWLGGSSLASGRVFTWVHSGQPITYSNWMFGNSPWMGLHGTCLTMIQTGIRPTEYKWFFTECRSQHHFACQAIKLEVETKGNVVDWKLNEYD